MKKVYTILFLVFTYSGFIYSKQTNKNTFVFNPPLSKTGNHPRGNIELVKDTTNQLFVIKTHIKADSIIKELIGAIIAAEVNASFNKAQLLDDHYYPQKKAGKHRRTLHTRVPGKHVAETYEDCDFCLRLKELFNHRANLFEIMTYSFDIPPIVAIDLFLANPDRNNQNIFFDNEHFYGIDMNSIYSLSPKAIFAICYKIKHKIKTDSFEPDKIQALQHFYCTLQKLIDFFPPQKIIQLWYELAKKVRKKYRQKEKIKLEKQIKETYAVIKEFVKDITTLLPKQTC